ncbi:UDP-Glc:alpha-D-GlcNAc-diphosphoundecaprenol beta-1,3-glucosyltransferase WfaP [Marinomonas aquimarina]|uniref:UDP-Glc:alpha-D-GlcNAc-diphosphoundecaprenol beta-1,3-glucosyltransferase WfaP n=1 Tax=Marinomonas aquimarina TaxID=295068 RepID=A0A1A8T3R5_9GAMM|nr:UDP-Glc:alpha-D-GlcNAc-diphosphoundecaprenol beta-1,3-glucosyltransferase WfaP [Marinomonas aquimarina]
MDKVQICLPVYNGEQHIRETVETLLSQTYENIEILILDDASSDGTLEIVQELAATDGRIRIERNTQNQGILFSRNKLFDLCSERYIALADADDLYHERRIEDQLHYLKQHQLGMVSCAYEAFGERSYKITPPEYHNDIQANMLLFNVILNPGVLLDRTKVSVQHCYVDPEYRGAADYDCWIKLLNKTRVGCVPSSLVKYRVHAAQESTGNFERQKEAHLRVLAREYRALSLPFNRDALQTLIWPRLYADTLSLEDFKKLGSFLKGLFAEVDKSQIPAKNTLSFALDIRYKGVARRHGVKGVLLYLKYAGLKRLLSGRKMGMSFVYDCLFRK